MNNAMLRFPNFKEKAFTLNYDDGLKCDEKLVEIMKKYGCKGTFNVNSALCAKEPATEYGMKSRLTLDECVKLYKSAGCEVAVHGAHHVPMIGVDRATAIDEIISDRKTFERAFGCIVKGMAYPYGKGFDEESKQIARFCGFSYSRTADSTHAFELPTDWMTLNPTCKQDDSRLFELAEQFANFKHDERRANGWFIKPPKWFIVWGHSTEMERANHWGRMDELCKMMGTRDDVWQATTGEVYDYVQAFHSLEFSVDSELVRNKSAFDIYLVVNCAKYVVPAGQTVRVGELSKGRELL